MMVQTFIFYTSRHILVFVLVSSYHEGCGEKLSSVCFMVDYFFVCLELCSPGAAPLQFPMCPSALVQ